VDRANNTFRELQEIAFQEFEIPENKRHNFRLRAFNVAHGIALDTYSGRENDTLQVLKIYPLKTLLLEEKAEDAVFEDYDPDSILVKLNPWRPDLPSLLEEYLQP
jgi:hypothetical protein